MGNFTNRWSDWTPETDDSKEIPSDTPDVILTGHGGKADSQESNTPRYATDKTDRRAFDGSVGSIGKGIPPEPPDLPDVVPSRDGTQLAQLAYEVRDARLIAECRSKAVELQVWLATHFDRHMGSEPFGLPEWISALAEFNVIERGHLRGVFHYAGCIHEHGSCPDEAPVCCTACEGNDG